MRLGVGCRGGEVRQDELLGTRILFQFSAVVLKRTVFMEDCFVMVMGEVVSRY